MSRKLTRLTAMLGTFALAAGLAACGGESDASSSSADPWSKYTFTIGEQSDGIVSLIDQSGSFADAPYKIKFAKFEYGPPLVAALSTGDVDLGMVGTVPPITGAASDLNFKIIAVQTPYDPNRAQENILVPKGSTLQSLEDLKGKRIAVPQGSSAHGLALNALKSVGLTPDDVELVYLDPKAAASAFSSGKVDAWSIWEPQSSLAVNDGARVLAAGVPPLDFTSTFYVGSNKSLDDPERRKALADVLERISKAYEFGNLNPDEHVKALATDTGLDPAEIEKSIDGWSYRLGYIGDDVIAAEQKFADSFFEAGEIDKAVDVTQVVDNLLPKGYNVG